LHVSNVPLGTVFVLWGILGMALATKRKAGPAKSPGQRYWPTSMGLGIVGVLAGVLIMFSTPE
jgi:uncharacterized membrane protein HdeD (DUF308 family)